MDPLSTGLGGALLARALPARAAGGPGEENAQRLWTTTTLTVTAAAVLPDVDIVFDIFSSDALASLTLHRAFTHSYLGAVVMAPLVALAVGRFRRDLSFVRLTLLALLGFLWHIFTDLCTSWGTIVYWPFSRERVVWDILFIIDFTFTAVLLLPHVLAWIYRDREGALRRGVVIGSALGGLTAALVGLGPLVLGVAYDWALLGLLLAGEAALLAGPAVAGWGFRRPAAFYCRAGIVALALYLSVCTWAHATALKRVEEFSARRGLRVEAQAALPLPLSPFRWSGLVRTPEGVYQGWLNVLAPPAAGLEGSAAELEFFSSARNGQVERASALPATQTYLWFARFPVARYREEAGRHIVEYTDLRFRLPYRRNPFVFRVVLNADGRARAAGFVEP